MFFEVPDTKQTYEVGFFTGRVVGLEKHYTHWDGFKELDDISIFISNGTEENVYNIDFDFSFREGHTLSVITNGQTSNSHILAIFNHDLDELTENPSLHNYMFSMNPLKELGIGLLSPILATAIFFAASPFLHFWEKAGLLVVCVVGGFIGLFAIPANISSYLKWKNKKAFLGSREWGIVMDAVKASVGNAENDEAKELKAFADKIYQEVVGKG